MIRRNSGICHVYYEHESDHVDLILSSHFSALCRNTEFEESDDDPLEEYELASDDDDDVREKDLSDDNDSVIEVG